MIYLPPLSGIATAFIGGGGIPIGVMSWLSATPQSQFWGQVIGSGPANDRREISLTFDDGPDGEFTPRILDILAVHQIAATFFVIGRNVIRYPEVIRRIDSEGHLLGNHTWDHDHHGYLRGLKYWKSQLERTNEAIEQIIGRRPNYFRPPMGLRTGHVMRAADICGLSVVIWTRRGMDGISTTAKRIENRIGASAQPGEIIVLHDGVEPNSRRSPAATCAALDSVLTQWNKQQLHPIRLDRWLQRPTISPAGRSDS